MRKRNLATNAKAALLVQINPNRIIFRKNMNKRLPIASITKLMAILTLLDGIDAGDIKWSDKVQVSKNAASTGGSKLSLKYGETITVEDLVKGMLIASANDAAVALAEGYSGTMGSFAEKMNNKAKALGLKNSKFENSHGLFEDHHYSTALDVMKMAMNAIKREEILECTSLKEAYIKQGNQMKKLTNTNKLIGILPEIDGLKTGHTPKAGFCLVASAVRNDVRLMAVVLGEPSKALRDQEVIEMLNYGFKVIKTN
ncbi:D-alanyl-D-alanine carboxypeptidase family protein [Alkaliphilus serpentinus]|uniref:D-alanyl-D-alanine carboxypeptidase n=1 Tax=Alkaliphilus serpentinus TaxID=1482731 RepID=A0A833M9A3_9FIRM|nr:D-alanyl-D-alanine carboxypeptidase family protein [Alkaliphilus serpentinus]KAB3529306.1 D-alanyl-D-alanine carboxypeptidase [Alkaliphilus serpentinus]